MAGRCEHSDRGICLVACAKTKQREPNRAEDLYISPLFRKCREFATHRFCAWYILSAKHGLLEPTREVDPYEQTMKEVPRADRREWAARVFRELQQRNKGNKRVTILAGRAYREFLVPLLLENGFKVNAPLRRLPIGAQLRWLNAVNGHPQRLTDLDEFYQLLSTLQKATGEKRMLGECDGRMDWPERGVYFLFEPAEMRTLDPETERIVRVGTHMISKGSRATLWNRLRTHRGTGAGGGNHRSSILRLHVGAAMLAKSNKGGEIPTWGRGQTAAPDIRALEVNLERAVSAYIARMGVVCLAVGDDAGPSSDRAYIERNVVGLLCGPLGPVDVPSPEWLGNWSLNESVRRSGLWNVNHTDYSYDPRFLDVFRRYVDAALGRSAYPKQSIAPADWYTGNVGKGTGSQMFLFQGGPNV